MPDANGHPLPGEPDYDAYAKSMTNAANAAGAGATMSREGFTGAALNVNGTDAGPVDSNGHPLPGNVNYDAYAKSMTAAQKSADAGAAQSRNNTSYQGPQGALASPGPYETWASEHGGDLGTPGAAETLYSSQGQGLQGTPSAAEDFYSKYGQDFANKSNSETLYSQGVDHLNPYYDYATQVGTKAINDAAAAHGGFSSTAMNQIGLLNANLRGQQAKDMANLAKQADDERLGRYNQGEAEAGAADTGKLSRLGLAGQEATASDQEKLNRYGAQNSLYGSWQDREENRLTTAFTEQMGLSGAQAGQVDTFFKNLLEAGKYDAEGINAALQAAGVDPNSAFAKDLVGVGKAYATSYAGGMGHGGG